MEIRILDPGEARAALPDLNVRRLAQKVLGEDTGDAWAMWELGLEAGARIPLHVHSREDELFYVLAGTYEFQVGDATIRAVTGALVFGPRGVPHGFRNIASGPGRTLNIVTPAGLERGMAETAALGGAGRERYRAIMLAYGVEFLEEP